MQLSYLKTFSSQNQGNKVFVFSATPQESAESFWWDQSNSKQPGWSTIIHILCQKIITTWFKNTQKSMHKRERNCPRKLDSFRSHLKAMRYHSVNLLGTPAWIFRFSVISAGIPASPLWPSTETWEVKSRSLYVSCYNANIAVPSTEAVCNSRINKFWGLGAGIYIHTLKTATKQKLFF